MYKIFSMKMERYIDKRTNPNKQKNIYMTMTKFTEIYQLCHQHSLSKAFWIQSVVTDPSPCL